MLPPAAQSQTGALVLVPELRAFSLKRIARVVPFALLLALVFAAFTAWWHSDAWRGAGLAFVWLPAWLMPQVYAVEADAITREPAWLARWRRRWHLDAGHVIARRAEVASWCLSEWRGHPAILVFTVSGDEEVVCTRASEGLKIVADWLDCGDAT